ncbi:hypothetical protein HPB47_004147 [Ixodes persulcatus]|uniref:Uncharacterized protein n=1 Tax=Ixodes persulcatus TaxID=34615 RepID=A0AC60PGI8_IXOPE|nr:hypothetical protein HPB47_004147 [Ixodes persulcatus]
MQVGPKRILPSPSRATRGGDRGDVSPRTMRVKHHAPPSALTAATKESADVPAGLHAMQCADESCESETSYMKHLFSSGKDPCADFYDFVCSNWKTQNALPPNRRRWAVQDLLVQKIEGAVYWFLEETTQEYTSRMVTSAHSPRPEVSTTRHHRAVT